MIALCIIGAVVLIITVLLNIPAKVFLSFYDKVIFIEASYLWLKPFSKRIDLKAIGKGSEDEEDTDDFSDEDEIFFDEEFEAQYAVCDSDEVKADYGRIFKSDIITDLLKVLGCGVEVEKHGKELNSFDLANLRWNKVVICTDADVDGFQIRTLILTMLWRLTPTLIREGYVYIAESPLYEIDSKNKTWYAYSDSEKNRIVEELGSAKFTVNRSKGLGENSAEMMWLTTMNPETRRLIRVQPEDAERTAYYFDLLLGDDLAGRKSHIAQEGYRYLDMADIS